MAELKTKATRASVTKFLRSIEPKTKQEDSFVLLDLFKKATGEKPVMWGTSIIGFGKYHYISNRSSQEGDWPLVGFSPRKQNLTLYVLEGTKNNQKLLKKLGQHTTGVGCLYIKTLSDIDLKILLSLIKESYTFKKRIANLHN